MLGGGCWAQRDARGHVTGSGGATDDVVGGGANARALLHRPGAPRGAAPSGAVPPAPVRSLPRCGPCPGGPCRGVASAPVRSLRQRDPRVSAALGPAAVRESAAAGNDGWPRLAPAGPLCAPTALWRPAPRRRASRPHPASSLLAPAFALAHFWRSRALPTFHRALHIRPPCLPQSLTT